MADRLHEAAAAAEKAIEATRVDDVEVAESESVGTALILAEVSDFYSKTSDARGSWRGRAKVATPNSARAAGRKAGINARLSAVPSLPGSKKAIAC